MKKFNHVIVRRPCKAMVEGITSGLYPGKPDYELALKEHDAYIEALKQCDVDVTVLEADERYPDSPSVPSPSVSAFMPFAAARKSKQGFARSIRRECSTPMSA